jgi:hypothetical protein
VPTTPQPYTTFDLSTTALPETIRFRFEITYTNNQKYLSPMVSYTISCFNDYTIVAVNTVPNPQYVEHNKENNGFTIPRFYSSY